MTRSPRLCLVAMALVVCACGPAAASGALGPTPPVVPNNPAPGQLPGNNPACQQASAPIQGIGQVEAALRSGGISDAAAESNVLSIQQTLVAIEQQVGRQDPIGMAIQAVVFQLGEVGTALNQNAAIDRLNPVFANVDAAVVALAQACANA